MLTYVNDINLPQDVYDAIVSRQSRYKPAEEGYSVTEILDPPRIVHLKRRYDYAVNISSVLESWKGQVIHDSLESPATSGRYYIRVNDVLLSGAYDYLRDSTLKDYKTTSVWGVVHGSVWDKWQKQLNVYAWMLRTHPIIPKYVDKLQIVAIFKDWDRLEKLRYGRDYPDHEIMTYDIAPWTDHATKVWVEDTVMWLENTKGYSDFMLPECTPEDMWCRPTTWALIKKGNKRATKVFDTWDDAMMWCDAKSILDTVNGLRGFDLVERPGERVRCSEYCIVKERCNQYEDYKNSNSGI